MQSGIEKMTCSKARLIDITEYLATIGYAPAKIRSNNYWYLSPFRQERRASFKVDRSFNRWYDHGIGKGGNLIDFGIFYHNCSVTEFLQSLEGTISFQQQPISSKPLQPQNKVEIITVKQLHSLALIKYLASRKIPFTLASNYCKEVQFKLGEKILFGIGFENDFGGIEIRNAFLKLSNSPKGITRIKNSSSEIALFEGFISFLSFLVCYPQKINAYDFLILNSLSFFENAIAGLGDYLKIYLFLDNDKAGQNCSHHALEADSRFIDKSSLYSSYKDWNDLLTSLSSFMIFPEPP